MQARMSNIAAVVPDVVQILQSLAKVAHKGGVPSSTIALIELRASQINGCGVCVDMHSRFMKQKGESDERLFGVAAWREMPYYTEAERAALALAEAVTRLSDRPDPVPNDVWEEATRHYDEKGLAALLIAIGSINIWNRFNVATKQIAAPMPESGWGKK